MSFTYCQHCGTKMEYTVKKPNFCSSCGEPLNGSVANGSSRAAVNNRSDIESTPASPTSAKKIPNISKLEYTIESYSVNQETIGSAVDSPGTHAPIPIKRKKYQGSSDSVVKDIIESCKSSKSRDIEEIE